MLSKQLWLGESEPFKVSIFSFTSVSTGPKGKLRKFDFTAAIILSNGALYKYPKIILDFF